MEESANNRSTLLAQEYQRAVQHMEQQFTHILQIVGIGFSALGAAIVLMSTSDSETKIKEWGFWGLPFILDILVAIVIYLLLHIAFAGYYVREIEDELSEHYDVPYLHFQGTVARGIFSFRSGITEMKAVLLLLLVIVAVVYCSLVVSCIVGLYNRDVPFWRLLAFTVLQAAITIALVWVGFGSTKSFRGVYEKWIRLGSTAADELAKLHGSGPSAKTWIRYIIAPKPIDLVMKPPLTLAAAGFTMLCLRIPPSWNLAIALVLATICLELLAKQATYVWNEILDMDKERLHPWKSKNRFLLLLDDGPRGQKIGKIFFLSRAVLAILMAIAIGDAWDLWIRGLPWFVGVILFVFVWQYLYERWGKSDPRRRLVMVGPGYSERTIVGAGVVLAVSNRWDPWVLILVTIWMCILQGMTIANLWRAENEYLSVDRDGSPHPADQSPGWFMGHNNQIQVWSALTLLLVGLVMSLSLTPASARPDTSIKVVAFVVCLIFGSTFIVTSYGLLMKERKVSHCWIEPIPTSSRLRWLGLAILVGAVAWGCVVWFATAGLAWAIAGAMAAPFVVIILSVGTTYDELNSFGEWLMQADKIGPWLDRKLFAPHSLKERKSTG